MNRRQAVSALAAAAVPGAAWAVPADRILDARNPYRGVGTLHNIAMESFGQAVVAAVRKNGFAAVTEDDRVRLRREALRAALQAAPRELPIVAGVKVSDADLARFDALAHRPQLQAVAGRLPAEVGADLERLFGALRGLGPGPIPRAFVLRLDELERKYAARTDGVVVLVCTAVARDSTAYWWAEAASDGGWVAQLDRLAGAAQPPVRGGPAPGGTARMQWPPERFRKWVRERLPLIGTEDASGALQGCLFGLLTAGIPGIVLGGMLGAAGRSLVELLS
jgi:hypothetical protein